MEWCAQRCAAEPVRGIWGMYSQMVQAQLACAIASIARRSLSIPNKKPLVAESMTD